MQPFLTAAFDDDRRPTEIQWQDPLDDLVDAEEFAGCETMDAGGIQKIPPEALLILLRFLIRDREANSNNRKRWRAATMRLAVLASLAGLDGVADLSLAELGRELDCTRSLLSLYSVRMADSLNQRVSRHGRSKESRQRNREAAIRSHAERGHRVRTISEATHED